MNTRLEAHKCRIGVLTREVLVSIGSGPNTQVQVDASRVLFDQYAVNEVKANTMILLMLKQGDVMALLAFPSAAGKWTNLAANHVSITISKGINAIQKFQSFSYMAGESVYKPRQRFDGLVTECVLQGIILTEN